MKGIKILLWLFIPVSFFAQNYENDLSIVMNSFSKARNYYVNSEIRVYSSDKKLKLLSNYKAWAKGSKEGTSSYLNGVRVVSNEQKSIIVDPESKTIQLQINDKSSKRKNHKEMILNSEVFDLKSKQAPVVSLLKSTGGVKEYKLDYTFGAYDYVKISLDVVKKKILKIEIKHNAKYEKENGFIEIVYKNFDFNLNFSKSEFSLTKYVTLVNGDYVLTPAYKNYQLLKP